MKVKMSEWNSVISVLGTLGGVTLGLVIGYWTSSSIEAKKERHEEKMYYRNKLTEHIDDIIKPFYNLIQELWGSLAVLRESVLNKTSIVKGTSIEDLLKETLEAYKKLKEFRVLNGVQIDLLLPYPLSTWVFGFIDEKIDKITIEVSQGKEPSKEVWFHAIDALMKYQKNLKKLIGYETEIELDKIYPFTPFKPKK